MTNAIDFYSKGLVNDSILLEPVLRPRIERIKETLNYFQNNNNHQKLYSSIIDRNQLFPKTTQLIIVYNENQNDTKGKLLTLEKKDSIWNMVFSPLDINLGARGFARPDLKEEWDYKTPTGIYSITQIFGYKNDLKTKMNFTELSDQHIWVTNSNSNDYNKIVLDTNGQYRDKGERLLRLDLLRVY